LRENKVTALVADEPEIIATANIGCLVELRAASDVPVVHWIELLDE
jgi:glycolate oxidase iron-sulfur subunit